MDGQRECSKRGAERANADHASLWVEAHADRQAAVESHAQEEKHQQSQEDVLQLHRGRIHLKQDQNEVISSKKSYSKSCFDYCPQCKWGTCKPCLIATTQNGL